MAQRTLPFEACMMSMMLELAKQSIMLEKYLTEQGVDPVD